MDSGDANHLTKAAATGERDRVRQVELYCPACQYNLTGIRNDAEARCPECGAAINIDAIEAARNRDQRAPLPDAIVWIPVIFAVCFLVQLLAVKRFLSVQSASTVMCTLLLGWLGLTVIVATAYGCRRGTKEARERIEPLSDVATFALIFGKVLRFFLIQQFLAIAIVLLLVMCGSPFAAMIDAMTGY